MLKTAISTLTVGAMTVLGAHSLAALPQQAETTRAEMAVSAVVSAAEAEAALSPTESFPSPARLAALDPRLNISPGSPLTAATSARTPRLVVRLTVAKDPSRLLVCAAAPNSSAVACAFTQLGARGPWYATATGPAVSMTDVARGVDATSTYGVSRGAPIPGFSPEGF